MCTVSVVPTAEGFQLSCNRDERRARAAALPPRQRVAGRARAVWPIDPESGGTWIGVNDAGIAMVVLNRTPCVPVNLPEEATSRGAIIPDLIAEATLEGAMERLAALLPTAQFPPFELVLLHEHDVVAVDLERDEIAVTRTPLLRPLLFTTSSLGDHVVSGPRRALFARMVCASRTPLQAQARFHRHQWPDRPDISVTMSRADAATVSRTTVAVSRGQARLHYSALSQP